VATDLAVRVGRLAAVAMGIAGLIWGRVSLVLVAGVVQSSGFSMLSTVVVRAVAVDMWTTGLAGA
jgi:hypothetical protein